MKALCELLERLDSTNSTLQKHAFLKEYFVQLDKSQWLYVVGLFTDNRPKKLISSAQMRQIAMQKAQIPEWLFESCYSIVGDLAETISLLIPTHQSTMQMNLSEIFEWLYVQSEKDERQRVAAVSQLYEQMNSREIFVSNKLLTGSWRIGVSEQMIFSVLAELLHTEPAIIAHRLSGHWSPYSHAFADILGDTRNEDISVPFPFMLAHTIDEKVFEEEASSYIAEYKWDGIRCQFIRRQGQTFIWSRGGELITDHFPELLVRSDLLGDGTVLDGEIIVQRAGKPGTFKELQTRILKKKPTRKDVESNPVHFVAYDILEWKSRDLRNMVQEERRRILVEVFETIDRSWVSVSKALVTNQWEALRDMRLKAKEQGCEGLMLKKKTGIYTAGRHKGDWWKWKLDPMVLDLVLTFAMSGRGRRANVYSDYTFGIWKEGELITITKAYSGLSAEEMQVVDSFIRANTVDSFGPVRRVKPELVFEIAFEGIERSSRHKSGFALRFPRISRMRTDKTAQNADQWQAAYVLWEGRNK